MPGIEEALSAAEGRLDRLAASYRGKVAGLCPKEMAALLGEYEAILELAGQGGELCIAFLDDAERRPRPRRPSSEGEERQALLAQKAVFLDIEWANAPEEAAAKLIADPLLSRWRHWLTVSRRNKPHLLSEPEEKILAEKSVTGRQAWRRYFDETLGAALFEWNGAMVPEEVVLRQLHEPAAEVRRKAAASITRGLQGILRTTTFITNNLLAEKSSDDRLRKYPTWISARNLDNQVEDATVAALIDAVTSRYDVVARYYRLKRRLLGVEQLFDYDRYAPLQAAQRRFSWEEAREAVLAAFGGFHPRMAQVASLFFENRWIDAALHPGKRGGAFAARPSPPCIPTCC